MRILVLIAVIPIILILKYIYNKDKDSEPRELLKKIFWYGVLTVIPVFILEVILNKCFPTDNYTSYIYLFISIFCGVAIVEEIFKWIVVRYFCYNNKEFDEIYDAIVYTTFSSLGFACLENLLFVLLYGTGTGVIRAFCAVPGHACFGIIMGYYLGMAKSANIKKDSNSERKNLVLSILIPTILHTVYDFAIFTHNLWFYLLWFIYIIILFSVSFNIVKRVSNNNKLFINRIRYCGNCGKECDTNYCGYCGYKNK